MEEAHRKGSESNTLQQTTPLMLVNAIILLDPRYPRCGEVVQPAVNLRAVLKSRRRRSGVGKGSRDHLLQTDGVTSRDSDRNLKLI